MTLSWDVVFLNVFFEKHKSPHASEILQNSSSIPNPLHSDQTQLNSKQKLSSLDQFCYSIK